MKKIIAVISTIALCAVVAFLTPVNFKVVEEADAQYYRFYCEAHSYSATGWGASNSLVEAKRVALRECSIRTPYGQVCRVVYTPSCPY